MSEPNRGSDKKRPDPGELLEDLLGQADETRRLIARFTHRGAESDGEGDAWRAKALLACLKNDNAILEALAALLASKLETPRASAPPPPPAAPAREVDAPPILVPPLTTDCAQPAPTNGTAACDEALVEGIKARAIVEEFDNRDHTYERGLEKLNSWVAGGKGALPFQKRDMHAYINRSASSEAMIARVESELMGREGFKRRLGRLKVDGLQGDILVYERG